MSRWTGNRRRSSSWACLRREQGHRTLSSWRPSIRSSGRPQRGGIFSRAVRQRRCTPHCPPPADRRRSGTAASPLAADLGVVPEASGTAPAMRVSVLLCHTAWDQRMAGDGTRRVGHKQSWRVWLSTHCAANRPVPHQPASLLRCDSLPAQASLTQTIPRSLPSLFTPLGLQSLFPGFHAHRHRTPP